MNKIKERFQAMKDIVKKYWKILLLAFAYTFIAITIYVMWFNSLWKLWFVDVIAAVVITTIGIVMTYFYIKSKLIKDKEAEELLKHEDDPSKNS